MTSDYATFDFVPGNIYAVELDAIEAVHSTHHGEGAIEPQTRYGNLEYEGPVGSGPLRKFRDWDSETEVVIDSHHIVFVESR